jgi:hypothetical protein
MNEQYYVDDSYNTSCNCHPEDCYLERDEYPTLEECLDNAFYHETHSNGRYTFDPTTVRVRRELTAEKRDQVNTLMGPLRLESIRIAKLMKEKDELLSKRNVHERSINLLRNALSTLQAELSPYAYQARLAKINEEFVKVSEYNLQMTSIEEKIRAK